MKKRRWTPQEVDHWRNEHPGRPYANREDGSLFVRKRCWGVNWSFNWGNPMAWVVVAAGIGLILLLACTL